MKIDKEQFNKLKQLDRIEFRQREDRINNYFQIGCGYAVIKMTIFIVAFFLLMAPQGYMLWGAKFINDFFQALRGIIGAFILIFVVAVIIDLGIILMQNKELKKLHEEYFTNKTEVKK